MFNIGETVQSKDGINSIIINKFSVDNKQTYVYTIHNQYDGEIEVTENELIKG